MKRRECIKVSILCFLLFLCLAGLPASTAAASSDPVLDWITIMNNSALAAGTSPFATSRVAALVSVSVFDAVNGIDPRFRPFRVRPNAPRYASQRAAAIQAAYAILVDVYPAQSGALAALRKSSLDALSENSYAVAAGVAWGQAVADAIWNQRLTDGNSPTPPPFEGVLGIVGTPAARGFWRPTPPLNTPGAGPQFATMTPWVLTRPSQFRLPPPYALTSAEFAADLSETRLMGSLSGSARSTDQSELALFWQSNTPLSWNRIASQVSVRRRLSFVENAHLFALLNVAMADAAIACWDSKYRFSFWRPITVIREGLTPADADPSWEPWLDFFPSGTPSHPEYPSAHASMSGSAAFILESVFGENTSFSVTSEVRPGTRSFSSFSSAVDEIADARVFGGIHFRTSCVLGNTLGRTIADYVEKHAMRLRGDDRDDDRDDRDHNEDHR